MTNPSWVTGILFLAIVFAIFFRYLDSENRKINQFIKEQSRDLIEDKLLEACAHIYSQLLIVKGLIGSVDEKEINEAQSIVDDLKGYHQQFSIFFSDTFDQALTSFYENLSSQLTTLNKIAKSSSSDSVINKAELLRNEIDATMMSIKAEVGF